MLLNNLDIDTYFQYISTVKYQDISLLVIIIIILALDSWVFLVSRSHFKSTKADLFHFTLVTHNSRIMFTLNSKFLNDQTRLNDNQQKA